MSWIAPYVDLDIWIAEEEPEEEPEEYLSSKHKSKCSDATEPTRLARNASNATRFSRVSVSSNRRANFLVVLLRTTCTEADSLIVHQESLCLPDP